MPLKKELTDLQKWVRKAFSIGMKAPEISAITTISENTLRVWFKKYGMSKREGTALQRQRHKNTWKPELHKQLGKFPSPGKGGPETHGLRKGQKNGNYKPIKTSRAADYDTDTAKSDKNARVVALDEEIRDMRRDIREMRKRKRELVKLRAECIAAGKEPLYTARKHTITEKQTGEKDGKAVDIDIDRTEHQRTPYDDPILKLDERINAHVKTVGDLTAKAERAEVERANAKQEEQSGDKIDRLADFFGDLAK